MNGPVSNASGLIGSTEELLAYSLTQEQWQQRFPKPDEGWDEDMDPPAIQE